MTAADRPGDAARRALRAARERAEAGPRPPATDADAHRDTDTDTTGVSGAADPGPGDATHARAAEDGVTGTVGGHERAVADGADHGVRGPRPAGPDAGACEPDAAEAARAALRAAVATRRDNGVPPASGPAPAADAGTAGREAPPAGASGGRPGDVAREALRAARREALRAEAEEHRGGRRVPPRPGPAGIGSPSAPGERGAGARTGAVQDMRHYLANAFRMPTWADAPEEPEEREATGAAGTPATGSGEPPRAETAPAEPPSSAAEPTPTSPGPGSAPPEPARPAPDRPAPALWQVASSKAAPASAAPAQAASPSVGPSQEAPAPGQLPQEAPPSVAPPSTGPSSVAPSPDASPSVGPTQETPSTVAPSPDASPFVAPSPDASPFVAPSPAAPPREASPSVGPSQEASAPGELPPDASPPVAPPSVAPSPAVPSSVAPPSAASPSVAPSPAAHPREASPSVGPSREASASPQDASPSAVPLPVSVPVVGGAGVAHAPATMATPHRDTELRRTFAAFGPRGTGGDEQPFAATWWGNAWVEALERGALDPKRLARGRGYADQGHVDAITVTPGLVLAYVRGSRPRPYRVQVRLRTLEDEDWERFLDAAADRPGHIAALLDKELPHSLADRGVGLLPGPGDLAPRCSCPDSGHPCKHAAALCYQTARLLDADPFVLLLLRGRGERELLDALSRRSAARAARAAQDHRPQSLPGVRAADALAPRRLPPPPPPLPVPPHPGQPPVYPSVPGGPDPFALDQLATDAAARAHALLATGRDPVGGLTLWQDAVRLAAARPGSGLTAGSRALYAALAGAAGRTPAELARAVAAWRQGGAEGLAVLEEPWDPPAGRFDRARPLLLAADLPAFRPWRNRLTHPRGHVQLRLGRDGLWYAYESEPGRDDWWPRGTSDLDPVGALTGLGAPDGP
ncbi:SWIM zinc finger family protein [Streptomyces sp. NPDC100445]|uniref:SWIM zinc finger family protein n=1 Tax=Streptomyces sp. NPDC100445 TaxID=3366102 RepID=UPI003807852E